MIRPSVLTCLGLFASCPSLVGQKQLPFGEIATQFLADSGLAGKKPRDVDLDTLLAHSFAQITIGVMDVYYPRAYLADDRGVEQFQRIAIGLLDVQEAWTDWTFPKLPADFKKLGSEIDHYRKWIKSWKPKAISQLATNDGSATRLSPEKAETAQANDQIAKLLGTMTGKPTARELIVLSPTRKHFVGLMAYIGAHDEGFRPSYWDDSVRLWTETWGPGRPNMQLIALESPSPTAGEDYTAGFDMNTREKTGLLEHVTQRAAFSLLLHTMATQFDQEVQGGVAQDLVIELLGENNARSGGSGVGNEAGAYGGFVPGGRSEGGGLIAANADSRFRETLGRDYFVRPLAKAQKAGAKSDSSPTGRFACFLLEGNGGSEKRPCHAPFLEEPVEPREALPAAFHNDLLELLRAYRSAFVFWLRNHAAGTKKKSNEQFAEFVRQHAVAPSSAAAKQLYAKVYGVPLSTPDITVDSLEQRFLKWLASQ